MCVAWDPFQFVRFGVGNNKKIIQLGARTCASALLNTMYAFISVSTYYARVCVCLNYACYCMFLYARLE